MPNQWNKETIYALLREKDIPFFAVDHPPAYTVEDIIRFDLPKPEVGAKNLFLRDDKKRTYYLLTVKDDRNVSIKNFQKKAGTRRLSFASEQDLMAFLGLIPGAVTPFGVLNDESRSVIVYMDDCFRGGEISVHPNDNTATVYLPSDALVKLIQEHGNPVEYFNFSDVSS